MMRRTAMMMTMMLMTIVLEAVASVARAEEKVTHAVGSCLANNIQRTCICQGSRVTKIPSNIPNNTVYLELQETQLDEIPGGALTNLQQLKKIIVRENTALEEIGEYAFYCLPNLDSIMITRAPSLTVIHPNAFVNLTKLQTLDISNTGLKVFPDFTRVNSTVNFMLSLIANIFLERIPANAFRGLCNQTILSIRMVGNGIREVESDAFNGTKIYMLVLKGNQKLTHIDPNAFVGSSGLEILDVSQTAVSSLPMSIMDGLDKLIAESAFSLKELPPPQLFTKLQKVNLTYPSHCCAFHDMLMNRSQKSWLCNHPEAQGDRHFYRLHCYNSPSITCSPTPDAFNPCEDIMAVTFLRVLIWIISILAILGNALVLLVLLGSPTKLTVPRFFMCHLAFADLCMGIYLLVIATVDIITQGHYSNYAIDWQKGPGCSAAGFFTVFASELSVFTLTAITLERWHTITHAMRLDRKLRMRHAYVVMAAGWLFSSLAALLPTVGVSSYSKVSICLPMDVMSLESQVYVVFLLLLNVLAFFCVCCCYLSIYLTVRNHSSPPAHADTCVAQRMAVLIFTDFLCMAPITFFAISAALNHPLITISHAKVLLVLFYPINSCANPFLYAFFTRNFRRDFFLLAARFGLFKTRAQIYRTESSSCQQSTWISPKSNHGTLYSLVNFSH